MFEEINCICCFLWSILQQNVLTVVCDLENKGCTTCKVYPLRTSKLSLNILRTEMYEMHVMTSYLG